MKKYQALYEYLLELDKNEWRATFHDLERVLGFSLPKSARVYRPWWSNQGGNSGHSHSMAWTNAGWRTSKVDMQGEELTFVRVAEPRPVSSGAVADVGRSEPTVGERIIAYLRAHPGGATNKDIAIELERSPTHIYQETSLLEQRGILKSTRVGNAKVYSLVGERAQFEAPQTHQSTEPKVSHPGTVVTGHEFQQLAQKVMSKWYGVPLFEKKAGDVPKIFDFVSDDETIVGDAKYYSMVRGQQLPPAKFATIAEHVWLLEKTAASKKFLVFGNDRRVPEQWLKRYGSLVDDVEFFFLSQGGKLEVLG